MAKVLDEVKQFYNKLPVELREEFIQILSAQSAVVELESQPKTLERFRQDWSRTLETMLFRSAQVKGIGRPV